MFKVSWGSCEDRNKQLDAGYKMLARNVAFFAIGDCPYTSDPRTKWGTTSATLTSSSTVADITTHYTQMWDNPGWQVLEESSIEVYMMWDDHEVSPVPLCDWDSSIAQINLGAAGWGLSDDITGQTTLNEYYAKSSEAWWDSITAYCDNPSNTDADAAAQISEGAGTHGAPATLADYAPKYFRVMKDVKGATVTSSPHIEFFVIDCVTHRDPVAKTDNSSKTMLGTTQKTWLKAQLLASTAKFKVIFTPKKTYKNTGADNADTWGQYSTELTELVAYIDTNITGVLWCAGDRHTPAIMKTTKTEGDTYDHLCVMPCPIGVELNAGASNTTFTNNTVHYWDGSEDQCFGELEIHSNHIDIRIINSWNISNVMWKGRILAGENRLDETKVKASI